MSEDPLARQESIYLAPDRRRYSIGDIRSALDCIACDDYADWMAVLAALKAGARDGRAGLTDEAARALFEAWSARSDQHEHRQLDYHWKRATASKRLHTLFVLAREHGWTKPEPPCCVEKIRIQDSDPTLFLISIVGREGEVVMRAEDLNSSQKFKTQVLDDVDLMVDRPTDKQINRLLEDAEHVAVDDGATLLGQFRMAIMRFLDENMKDDKSAMSGPSALACWRDEKTGRSWFKSDDLIMWLKRDRLYQFGDQADLYRLVAALGGGHDVLYLGRSEDGGAVNRRLWHAPLDPRANMIGLDGLVIARDVEFEARAEEARAKDLRRYHAQKREGEAS